MREVHYMISNPMKRRGRPRKTLEEEIKEGLEVNNIAETLVFN